MAFAAIYVPDFAIQAIVSAEPQLRGRAIALLDGKSPLFTVIAMNESAKHAGIQIGMTASQAAQFCAVEKRHRSGRREEAVHSALLDLCWSVSPRIEDAALDTIVLDLAGMHSCLGSATNIARQLTQRAAELGLKINSAISEQIEVAIHAARGFTGTTIVPLGEESEILAVLPIRVLFPSSGSMETLERWGVRTCGDLAALPVQQLSERLGQEGVRLRALARGEFVRSLIPAEPQALFTEKLELDDAVDHLDSLSFLLGRLLHDLCVRLQNCSLAASAVHLRFALGDAFEKQSLLAGGQPDAESAPEVYERTLRLPVPTHDSRLLLNLLRLHLQSDPPQASIVDISLAAEPSRKRASQKQLFQPNSVDPEKLEWIIARLSKLVGTSNVGAPQTCDTHRPDAFCVNRFRPVSEPQQNRRKGHGNAGQFVENRFHEDHPQTALRMFRPEWPARIIMQREPPARISFRGLHGTISAASGPWRTSGDWWREDAWNLDEWDVYIRFDSVASRSAVTPDADVPDGVYRIYYDHRCRKWYLRGRYD